MAWLAVDKSGTECGYTDKPERCGNIWTNAEEDEYFYLEDGTIELLLGRVLTWDDEPVEIGEIKHDRQN